MASTFSPDDMRSSLNVPNYTLEASRSDNGGHERRNDGASPASSCYSSVVEPLLFRQEDPGRPAQLARLVLTLASLYFIWRPYAVACLTATAWHVPHGQLAAASMTSLALLCVGACLLALYRRMWCATRQRSWEALSLSAHVVRVALILAAWTVACWGEAAILRWLWDAFLFSGEGGDHHDAAFLNGLMSLLNLGMCAFAWQALAPTWDAVWSQGMVTVPRGQGRREAVNSNDEEAQGEAEMYRGLL